MVGYRVKPCGTCGFFRLFRKEEQTASKPSENRLENQAAVLKIR